MNSLLGPFSIIAATIISIIYYQNTKELIISLIIGLVGPFLLHFILRFFLKTWAVATNTDIKPGFVSRLGGAILTLIWGWVFIILFLIMLAVLPPLGGNLTAVHNDVTRSRSYSIAKPLQDIFFAAPQKNVTATTNVPSFDAKSLAEDPRFQKILQDPEIQKEINEHDIVKLMSNPKMIELTNQIMSDPATLKKVMAIYSHSQTQTQENSVNAD